MSVRPREWTLALLLAVGAHAAALAAWSGGAGSPGSPDGARASGGESRVHIQLARGGPPVPSAAAAAAPRPAPRRSARPAAAAVAARVDELRAPRTPPTPAVAAAPPPGSEKGETGEPAEETGTGDEAGGPTGPAHGERGPGADPFAAAGLRDAALAYRAAVSQRVGRALRYPRRAQRAGTQGTAVVWVRLDRQGSLAHVALSEGSGSEQLDGDALRTVERAAPFAAPPAALPDAALEFDIPVQYSLDR